MPHLTVVPDPPPVPVTVLRAARVGVRVKDLDLPDGRGQAVELVDAETTVELTGHPDQLRQRLHEATKALAFLNGRQYQDHPAAATDPRVAEPVFSLAYDRFWSWWLDEVDYGLSWNECFNSPTEAANVVANDTTGIIVGTSDWELLVYRQHDGETGRCDGILVAARRRSWGTGIQLATHHIDAFSLNGLFTGPDPTRLVEELISHGNHLTKALALPHAAGESVDTIGAEGDRS